MKIWKNYSKNYEMSNNPTCTGKIWHHGLNFCKKMRSQLPKHVKAWLSDSKHILHPQISSRNQKKKQDRTIAHTNKTSMTILCLPISLLLHLFRNLEFFTTLTIRWSAHTPFFSIRVSHVTCLRKQASHVRQINRNNLSTNCPHQGRSAEK